MVGVKCYRCFNKWIYTKDIKEKDMITCPKCQQRLKVKNLSNGGFLFDDSILKTKNPELDFFNIPKKINEMPVKSLIVVFGEIPKHIEIKKPEKSKEILNENKIDVKIKEIKKQNPPTIIKEIEKTNIKEIDGREVIIQEIKKPEIIKIIPFDSP